MKKLNLTAVICAAFMLTACGSTENESAKIPLDNDPRIGEKVNRVCFVNSINGWAPVDNDRNAVLITMNNRERYKLKLIGACDPDLAMLRAAFITRPGSSCLSRGDKVKTDGDLGRGRGSACTIMSIHAWDPEAIKQQDEDKETENGKSETVKTK